MPFYKFWCSYVMLYNIQNTWCLFCLFCDYWFEIINYNMQYIYIHMCYKCLACESNVASIFNSGQYSGLPTELPTISLLESSGLPTELLTELPTISVYRSSGQPYLHGKIPMGSSWAAHSTAHWAANFFIFGNSWLPTELPTVSIYGSSEQPNLHGKIPMGSPLRFPLSCPLFNILKQWAAYWTVHWAAHCFHIWK